METLAASLRVTQKTLDDSEKEAMRMIIGEKGDASEPEQEKLECLQKIATELEAAKHLEEVCGKTFPRGAPVKGIKVERKPQG